MLSRVSSMVATAGSRASSTAVSTATSTTLISTSSSSSPRLNAAAHHSAPSPAFLRQTWLYESFLARPDQYERLATGTSPRIGVAALGYALIRPYMDQRPLLEAAAAPTNGLVNGHPAGGLVNGINGIPDGIVDGRLPYPDHLDFELPREAAGAALGHNFIGLRIKKLGTWPMTKKELKIWEF